MAGRGPAPKDPAKRERRNAEPVTQLTGDAKVAAPKLPGANKFLAATRAWYATWCSSLQAAQFLATDWQRLHMLAPLVDRYFREPDPRLLGEIRLNEQKLGATAEDRLRLRWHLREAEREEERTQKKGARKSSRRRADPRLKLVEGGGA